MVLCTCRLHIYNPHSLLISVQCCLELASDAVVGLLKVSGVDVHLLVEAVKLIILSVKFVSHVPCYALQISQHIRYSSVR